MARNESPNEAGDQREPKFKQGPDGRMVPNTVVGEAQVRFRACSMWESQARNLFLDDLKFDAADSDNGYQWPNEIRRARDVDERPTLTINEVRQHNLQIINDAKQNKPGIMIRPTGNGATKESADTLESIIRHIEYISKAEVAYSTATEFQVRGGIGYVRVITDYEDPESMNQEIYIKRVQDPLTIFLDPDAKEADKSDARYAFVFEDVPHDRFDELYPKFASKGTRSALGDEGFAWITRDTVRVAEYFRKVEEEDVLVSFVGPQGDRQNVLKSLLPKNILDVLLKHPETTTRDTRTETIEWYLIVGEEVAEHRLWPGKYIPIIPVLGEETIIEGVLDRKGHTRAMKDPQRMYNYWSSSAVENVALQGKTPWIAPAEAIEGYEGYWNTANRVNHSVLPYNAFDDAGNPMMKPERPPPAIMAPAYISGMQIAQQELMMVSGQYQSQMGEPSNERTGKAINERQRQGDNATYHYIDNLAVAIRQVGRVILDLIPKVYDSARVMMILAEDGTSFEIEVDPNAKRVYQQRLLHDQVTVQRIFNPSIGRYDVEVDIGPGYATKRQQAFDSFTLLLTQSPQLTGLIGDIMLRAADFPMADEAAERLKRMLPPQATGDGPTPQVQQLQQQNQTLEGIVRKGLEELTEEKAKLKSKDQMRDIDAYNAETDRLKVVAAGALDQGQLKVLVQQLIRDTLMTGLGGIVAENSPSADGQPSAQGGAQGGAQQPGELPPMPGARRAPDGHWYVADPGRPGKYQMVLEPGAQPPGGPPGGGPPGGALGGGVPGDGVPGDGVPLNG